MLVMSLLGQKYEEGGPNTDHYRDGMVLYSHKILDVQAGFIPWWSADTGTHHTASPSEEDETSYECDTSLGIPDAADCSQLEDLQLGAPSDTIAVGPGAPKILSSSE